MGRERSWVTVWTPWVILIVIVHHKILSLLPLIALDSPDSIRELLFKPSFHHRFGLCSGDHIAQSHVLLFEFFLSNNFDAFGKGFNLVLLIVEDFNHGSVVFMFGRCNGVSELLLSFEVLKYFEFDVFVHLLVIPILFLGRLVDHLLLAHHQSLVLSLKHLNFTLLVLNSSRKGVLLVYFESDLDCWGLLVN